ncbi:MAG: DUF1599 domain-containing protein [Bacteroidales bacterium]|nr:DUF1599 domain-containing protein [Bacteroidales bacterium]
MKNNTPLQFEQIVRECKDIFFKKTKDYGTAWRILRISSLTDQIYIKANRIRSLQEKGTARINEGIRPEFIGIINYSVMALIQMELKEDTRIELPIQQAQDLYDKHLSEARSLMEDKNHDYDEAWRMMRVSSLTDIILMKLLRVKQIEDNQGETLISEGIDANYHDIINYAVFAMIQMSEADLD